MGGATTPSRTRHLERVMFKQTASIWRRLTSRRRVGDAPAGSATPEDERRMHGRLQTNVRTRASHSEEPATWFEVRVHDGDRVKAGDILVRLDETVTRANLAIVTKGLNELYARKARLAAERDGAEGPCEPGAPAPPRHHAPRPRD